MRSLFWGFVLLSIAVLGYCGWALYGAVQLATVAQQGGTAAIMERVDLVALRRSLARQIVSAYMRQDEKLKNMRGIGRSLVGGMGTSIADAMLEDILTPDNITKLLKDGRLGGGKNLRETGVQLPKIDAAQTQGIATVLNTTFTGSTQFVVPIAHTGETYDVHLALDGAIWKLSGIDLPASLLDRLGKEVGERQKQ